MTGRQTHGKGQRDGQKDGVKGRQDKEKIKILRGKRQNQLHTNKYIQKEELTYRSRGFKSLEILTERPAKGVQTLNKIFEYLKRKYVKYDFFPHNRKPMIIAL